MQIIITGAGGFLGQRLANALLTSNIHFTELVLTDLTMPANPGDGRVKCVQLDLAEEGAVESLVTSRTELVFHLAAIVSSHAERDFDLGWRINMDVTRRMLEACRSAKPGIRFIFSSSVAVYGGKLPPLVNDFTVVTPGSSYGIQKAMGELLVNEYSRKGFVDGRALRLPTICVRPGKPNLAASSFVSSIIREPLNGEEAICPVSPALSLFLSSPKTVIENLMRAARLESTSLSGWRTINLPGITITVKEMLETLRKLTDEQTLAKVKFIYDEAINTIVSTWPSAIDNTRALELGFKADQNFEALIRQYFEEIKQP